MKLIYIMLAVAVIATAVTLSRCGGEDNQDHSWTKEQEQALVEGCLQRMFNMGVLDQSDEICSCFSSKMIGKLPHDPDSALKMPTRVVKPIYENCRKKLKEDAKTGE